MNQKIKEYINTCINIRRDDIKQSMQTTSLAMNFNNTKMIAKEAHRNESFDKPLKQKNNPTTLSASLKVNLEGGSIFVRVQGEG